MELAAMANHQATSRYSHKKGNENKPAADINNGIKTSMANNGNHRRFTSAQSGGSKKASQLKPSFKNTKA